MIAPDAPDLPVGSLARIVPDLAKFYHLQEGTVARAVQTFLTRRHAYKDGLKEGKLQAAHRLLTRRANAPLVKGTPGRRVYWVHALYEKGDVFVRVRF
jgi:hypothetical protein